MTKLLYKPTEAAEVLGLSRSGIFRLLSTGELESVKIGGLRRIPASALESYVHRLQEQVRGDRPRLSAVQADRS